MTQSNPRAAEGAPLVGISAGEVRAALTFVVPQDSKPYFNSSALTGGVPEIFFESEEHTVTIRDMRPMADDLSLDRQGFVLLRHVSAVDDLRDGPAQRLVGFV